MDIENQKDRKIIDKILKQLNISYKSHKYFHDGASSRVILLNGKYLIKQNEKNVLKSEVEFLTLNHSEVFQKIILVDLNYEFVVYDFIEGETMKSVENVDDLLQKIIEITSGYQKYEKNGFGYLNEEVDTWTKFLEEETIYSSSNLSEMIPDNSLVFKCIYKLEKYSFDKKLLHGDFGTHNFIKQDGKLVGIIDPTPVIGDSLYDLLFAIVSNVSILSLITPEKLYQMINEPKEKIDMMLTITLYSRISRCLKYHSQDIDIYMSFWRRYIIVKNLC
ncbi:MAG: phosphotransferase [Clostridia bacterium]|nr:phosphotransferase [Clostridia bacterium]